MIKIKSRQEKTTGEKSFIGLNVATPGAAQEDTSLLAGKVSQPACLYHQKSMASK
jgi:hypothetical protein